MTHTQLEHLKLIDAHLERLLELAAKRTPGEWAGEYEYVAQIIPNQIAFGEMICEGKSYYDMDFIASCAGNAEAGWRATRAAIDWLFTMQKHGGSQEIPRLSGLAEDILAAFPLELIQKP